MSRYGLALELVASILAVIGLVLHDRGEEPAAFGVLLCAVALTLIGGLIQ